MTKHELKADRAALLKRVDRAIARVDRELARLEKP